MTLAKKRDYLTSSEEGVEIERALQRMTDDSSYNTQPSYSANTLRYPDNLMSFVDKHMNYINAHPSIDPNHYISNLRLMTRIA